MKLGELICDAQKCSANLGAKYAHAFTYGEASEELKWNFLTLNALLRTLIRNQGETVYKKEKVKVDSVSIDSLQKKNSFLYLKCDEKVVCKKTKISPCLSDSEISYIAEQIKLLCDSCNCNC